MAYYEPSTVSRRSRVDDKKGFGRCIRGYSLVVERDVLARYHNEARVKHVFQNLLSGIPGFQTLCDTDFGEEFGRVNAVSDLLVQTLKVSPLIMRQPN